MFEIIERILNNEDHELSSCVKQSIDVIENALRIFGINQLAVSFNGGKDATIVLHLVRFVLFKRNILGSLGTEAPILYFDDPK